MHIILMKILENVDFFYKNWKWLSFGLESNCKYPPQNPILYVFLM